MWATVFRGIPSCMRIDLCLAQAGQIVVHGVLGIETEVLGVSADESAIEHASGQLIELFLFDSLQHARADFCDVGNIVERELFFLACFAKFVSELAHVGQNPSDWVGNIIGQDRRERYGTDGQGLGNLRLGLGRQASDLELSGRRTAL